MFLTFGSYAQGKEYHIDEIKTALDSINISKIKSACDCSDGMEKVARILYRTTEGFSAKKEVLNDPLGMQIAQLTTIKTREIAIKCEQKLGLNDSDILECESFKSLEAISNRLNVKFRK